jgi:hypothetical protein
MKKLFFSLIAAMFISVTGIAQVSESINYQAVARNNAGAAIANQTIKVRFTISRNAVSQYSETRQVITNTLGLFNVQIGSAGAISTTGTFNAIDWMNNTPNMLLKVELDINNSGVFTEMGFQAFSSVPFAFAAKKAFEAENTLQIAGRPLDLIATPAVGSRLSWNGSNWTPVKKDTVYTFNSTSTNQSIAPSSTWHFTHANIITITVNDGERIVASMATCLSNLSTTIPISPSISICYQNTDNASNPVVPFSSLPLTPTIGPTTVSGSYNAAFVAVTNATTLAPGTYRIGFGVRNNFTNTANLFCNTNTNGTIEIKY